MSKSTKKKKKEPQYLRSPLNNPMPNYKVYYMNLSEALVYSLLLWLAGGVVGLIFYGGLFKVDGESTMATRISDVVVFVLMGFAAVKVFLPAVNHWLLDKMQAKLRSQFMNFMESLSTSLSAGNNLMDAVANSRTDLKSQYKDSDYIMRELSEIISGIQNGRTLEEMMRNFGRRSANEDIMNFANVLSNCYRLGGDFGDVVRQTRELIADKIAVSEEINTKVSSNKLQLNVMCLMPIALVGMIKSSNADFAANLSSFLGVIVTTIAVAIFVGAYFWGQKIVDIR